MKRLIPLVKDDVYGLFDRPLSGKVVLVTMDAIHMSRLLTELLDTFIRTEHKKGVVISYDRPAECIRAALKKAWVPMEDLVIIDGVTRIGGLPKKVSRQSAPHIKVLEDPFDLKYIMATLEEVLKTEFSGRTPGQNVHELVPGRDSKDLEEVLIKAELDLFGMKGSEPSLMKRRIMQRVKEQVRSLELQARQNIDAQDLRRGIPPSTAVSVDQWQASLHDCADFVILENLAALSAYFGNQDLDELLLRFKELVAGGLCTTVLIFLDTDQYTWLVEGLKEGPDLGFELEETSDMGVQGFRFAPYDNSL
jgi:hypothetical protein